MPFNKKRETKIISPHMPKEVKDQGPEVIENQMWFLRLFLLSVIFGFVSGIVGGMVVNSSFFDNWLWGEGGAWKSLNPTPIHQEAKVLNKDDLFSKIMAVTADIYINGDANKDGLLVPSQKIASGFFLTSNGYLATSKKLFDRYNKNELVIVDQDRNLFKIDKVLFDTVSDLALIKIVGDNFSSAPFIFGDDLTADMDVYLPISRSGLYATKIVASNSFLPQSRADYYLDSENIYRSGLLKNSFNKNSLGSPVFNGKGEIVGLLFGQSVENNGFDKFLSSSVIQTALNRVMENQKISRIFLGLHYQEVEFNKTLKNNFKNGIILVSNPYNNLPSVDKKSPLLQLGLKSGDMILEVEGESLTAWRTLPEILLDYKSGANIKIKYLQDNQEKTATVEL